MSRSWRKLGKVAGDVIFYVMCYAMDEMQNIKHQPGTRWTKGTKGDVSYVFVLTHPSFLRSSNLLVCPGLVNLWEEEKKIQIRPSNQSKSFAKQGIVLPWEFTLLSLCLTFLALWVSRIVCMYAYYELFCRAFSAFSFSHWLHSTPLL